MDKYNSCWLIFHWTKEIRILWRQIWQLVHPDVMSLPRHDCMEPGIVMQKKKHFFLYMAELDLAIKDFSFTT